MYPKLCEPKQIHKMDLYVGMYVCMYVGIMYPKLCESKQIHVKKIKKIERLFEPSNS